MLYVNAVGLGDARALESRMFVFYEVRMSAYDHMARGGVTSLHAHLSPFGNVSVTYSAARDGGWLCELDFECQAVGDFPVEWRGTGATMSEALFRAVHWLCCYASDRLVEAVGQARSLGVKVPDVWSKEASGG